MTDRVAWVDADVVRVVEIDGKAFAEIDILLDGAVVDSVTVLLPAPDGGDDGEVDSTATPQASQDRVRLPENPQISDL